MCFQRPRRTSDSYSSHFDVQLVDTSSRLPDNFAIRLLEREMHLERTFEKSTVEELVVLYSTAIEYYNTKEDDQALNYQLRMQKMLKRPEVLKIFSMSPTKKPDLSLNEETIEPEEATEPDSTNTEKPEFLWKELETPRSTQATAEVKRKEVCDRVTGDKLADSLKSQENDLETRLKRRKIGRALSGISFVYSPVSEVDSPKSPKSPKSIIDEIPEKDEESEKVQDKELERKRELELETRIQDIMESSYEEKSAKIAEITVKYSTEINSLEESGGLEIVINQLKVNMNDEIAQVNKEFDDKRRAQVKAVREEFAFRAKSLS